MFFFFKQKTAYEMRISDWSSDVCSSDLFLTARDSDLDVVSGLRLGADDYLSKSISLPQLTARVQALFRRIEALRKPAARETVVALRQVKLELERSEERRGGKECVSTCRSRWSPYH